MLIGIRPRSLAEASIANQARVVEVHSTVGIAHSIDRARARVGAANR